MFWAIGDEVYANSNFNDIIQNGGYILKYQLQQSKDAIISWREYYDMNEEQVGLTEILFNKKLVSKDNEITLTEEEKSILINLYGDNLEDCVESLNEMKIYF